ncbi:MAG: hypothetical protein JSS66_13810 [Armatimonadetes bacterium]|nr:hypothetical protein [Armatimonadota bacterium]
MRIKDYESGRFLSDVSVELTRGEAMELSLYLARMLERNDLCLVHITDLSDGLLERELTFTLQACAA